MNTSTETSNKPLAGRFEFHGGRLVLIPDADSPTEHALHLGSTGMFLQWRGSVAGDNHPYIPAGLMIFRPDGAGRFFLSRLVKPQIVDPQPFMGYPQSHSLVG